MTQPVFRFAPSPNGRLHLGHALSALTNQGLADATAGRLLLRIEDIDIDRCTPEFEAGLLDDLRWLGLRWEEPARRQSEHFDAYAEILRRLEIDGLVYPAFLRRGEARAHIAEQEGLGVRWPRDPDGVPCFPAIDRVRSRRERAARMAPGAPFGWRLNMSEALAHVGKPLSWTEASGERLRVRQEIAADPAAWGDVLLARREVPTSYHLSVVVDDALQGVTHVVRGRDLFLATAVHRLLQELLGLPAPVYHHHRLVLGPDGRKLSKRFGDTALSALRKGGATPADIAGLVGLDQPTLTSEKA